MSEAELRQAKQLARELGLSLRKIRGSDIYRLSSPDGDILAPFNLVALESEIGVVLGSLKGIAKDRAQRKATA